MGMGVLFIWIFSTGGKVLFLEKIVRFDLFGEISKFLLKRYLLMLFMEVCSDSIEVFRLEFREIRTMSSANWRISVPPSR